MATPQSGQQQCNSTFTPHHYYYFEDTNNCRRTTTHLLNACQCYITIGSLAHVHMLPLTHKQLHHYSLTNRVCSGKGSSMVYNNAILLLHLILHYQHFEDTNNCRCTTTHLLNACQHYTTIRNLAHVRTHAASHTQTITPLLTYHLCLSRKGCRTTRKNKEFSWNVK